MSDAAPRRDLTQEGAPGANESAAAPKRIAEQSYDPVRDRENIRGKIAIWLIVTLVLVIGMVVLIGAVTAALCGYSGKCVAETIELKAARAIVEMVLTPLVGLVGAVTGFYYGEKSGSNARNGAGSDGGMDQ